MMALANNPDVRVLLVDDSSTSRAVMRRILETHAIEVTAVADLSSAEAEIAVSRLDAVLVSLPITTSDGVTLIRRLLGMGRPVIICADADPKSAEVALRAVADGAVDVVSKPRLHGSAVLEESLIPLLDSLRSCTSYVSGRHPASYVRARVVPRADIAPEAAERSVVAIGASTGGIEALAQLLASLPEGSPGVVASAHLPEAITPVFARRAAAMCRIDVREAVDGDLVQPGVALLAPGDRHLVVRRDGTALRARVVDGPLICRHRPSVDVLFRSVADTVGRHAIGVLLSGVGRDGSDGMRAMKARGAFTLAQDEASSIMFSMPSMAIAHGVVDQVVPLGAMADAIVQQLGPQRAARSM
jgi:two-component system chemotaxis response regulator CheB